MPENVRSNLKTTAKNYLLLLPFFAVLFFISCNKVKESEVFTISEDLQITKINERCYIHVSYLTLKNGNTFPSNGFIYTNDNDAYIFDTPATDKATLELIRWLQVDKHMRIKGVVLNHSHSDCTEGMDVFQKYGIPSIASKKTAKLLLKKNQPKPNLLFKK